MFRITYLLAALSAFATAFYPLPITPLRSSTQRTSTTSPIVTATDPSTNAALYDIVKSLESKSDPLTKSALLLGKYRMVRNFSPKNLDKESNAAGGAWVREARRFKLINVDLFQHLLTLNNTTTAINLVVLRLAILKFTIILRGDCTFLSKQARDEIAPSLSENCVQADFDSPLIRLSILHEILGVTFRVGPRSSVTLDASYVDQHIRIGKGASGVRFWLTRIAESSTEGDEYQKLLSDNLVFGKRGILVGMGAIVAALTRFGGVKRRILATLLAAVMLRVGKMKGGIIDDRSSQSLKQQAGG